MKTEEMKKQSKKPVMWVVPGVAVLVVGILAAMLLLGDPAKTPGETETTGTTEALPTTTEPEYSEGVMTEEPPQTENIAVENPEVTSPEDITTEKPETTSPAEPTQTEDYDPENPEATDPAVTVPATEATEPVTDATVPEPSENDPESQTTKPEEEQQILPEQQLVCKDHGLFSGAFVEDGTDEPVENVAALLVTNGSQQYLDMAQLTYDLDGQEAIFLVTGLPAGSSAWVLEVTGKTANESSVFQHVDTISSFRADPVSTLEGVDLDFNGTMLKATNTTDKTFKELTVYYKVLHTDGNYLGGITYMVAFGDLEPGQSAQKIAGHFQQDNTHIVRIGYREE